MDIERNIDGLVGRMVQWLTRASYGGSAVPSAASKPTVQSVSRPTVTSSENVVETTAEELVADLDAVVQGAANKSPLDPRQQKVLDGLADIGGEATMSELVQHLELSRSTLRRRLKVLVDEECVQRVGAGIGPSRYRLTPRGTAKQESTGRH